jgi:hypothetical protein
MTYLFFALSANYSLQLESQPQLQRQRPTGARDATHLESGMFFFSYFFLFLYTLLFFFYIQFHYTYEKGSRRVKTELDDDTGSGRLDEARDVSRHVSTTTSGHDEA